MCHLSIKCSWGLSLALSLPLIHTLRMPEVARCWLACQEACFSLLPKEHLHTHGRSHPSNIVFLCTGVLLALYGGQRMNYQSLKETSAILDLAQRVCMVTVGTALSCTSWEHVSSPYIRQFGHKIAVGGEQVCRLHTKLFYCSWRPGQPWVFPKWYWDRVLPQLLYSSGTHCVPKASLDFAAILLPQNS